MHHAKPIERLIDLLDPGANVLLGMSPEEAVARVASGDAEQIRAIDGQFALVHRQGTIVRMARSLGRPMRYFLAKRAEGSRLIVAERVRGFETVVVENHPRLCTDACVRFRDLLETKLEIAIGLETVHPDVLPALNKQMTLARRGAGGRVRLTRSPARSPTRPACRRRRFPPARLRPLGSPAQTDREGIAF